MATRRESGAGPVRLVTGTSLGSWACRRRQIGEYSGSLEMAESHHPNSRKLLADEIFAGPLRIEILAPLEHFAVTGEEQEMVFLLIERS